MSGLGTDVWLVTGIVSAGGLVVTFAILLVLSARTASGHLETAANLSDARSSAVRAARPGAGAAAGIAGIAGRSQRFIAPVEAAGDAGSGDDSARHTLEQLNEYYAANISQGNAIFWASLLSMSIGFAIVFAAVVTAGTTTTTAVVAGIAGVLSQFIAATFLVALRSTQQQSTTFAQMLTELRLRDLRAAADDRASALGLRLLDELAGDGAEALANQTRAALAMGLIVKGIPAAAPPATTVTVAAPTSEGDDAHRFDGRSGVRPRVPTISAEDRGAPAPPIP